MMFYTPAIAINHQFIAHLTDVMRMELKVIRFLIMERLITHFHSFLIDDGIRKIEEFLVFFISPELIIGRELID